MSPGVSALNTFVPHSFHPFIVHSATLLFSTFSVSFCRLRLCSPCESLGKREGVICGGSWEEEEASAVSQGSTTAEGSWETQRSCRRGRSRALVPVA